MSHHGNDAMIDFFLDEIATHSPECECTKCLEQDVNQLYEEAKRAQQAGKFNNVGFDRHPSDVDNT